MNRIAAVVAFVLFLLTPRAFAQVVVGDYSPVDVGYGDNQLTNGGADVCNIIQSGCEGFQFFSLASGTYVNQIDVGLVTRGNISVGSPVELFVLVWPKAVFEGCAVTYTDCPVVFYASSTLTLPSLTHDQIYRVPFLFPKTWLPAGSYYLSVIGPGDVSPACTYPASGPCHLEWAPNQSGSPQVGAVGPGFVDDALITRNSHAVTPLAPLPGTNGTFAFALIAQTVPLTPVGGSFGHIIQLLGSVIFPPPPSIPVTPPLGSPIEAELGFLDMNGNPIGPSSRVTLRPGETRSLDLNVSEFIHQPGQRIEVQPVITVAPDGEEASNGGEETAERERMRRRLPQVSATVQILDALSGFDILLYPAPQPGASSPALVPQALAGGETMRFNAMAGAANPCIGQLSFADKNGDPLGPSIQLDLRPGTGTSLDLNADTLGLAFGQRIEVQPIVIVMPPLTAGPPLTSVCQTSVEVFDHISGRILRLRETKQPSVARSRPHALATH